MSYELNLQCVTGKASGDLSSYQYYPVSKNSSGEYAVVRTLGARIDGILQNVPAARGRGALVGVGGISKAKVNTATAGTAISIGDSLICGSTGGTLAKSSTGGTAYRFARAEEAASTSTANSALLLAVRITNEGPTSTA